MDIVLDILEPFQGDIKVADGWRGAVVVDLFRATSTLQMIVEAGAVAAIAASLLQARVAAATGQSCVGEWLGMVPPDFVCGNSPIEISGRDLSGRELVFLSSNGGPTIRAAAEYATAVLLGNLFNAGAVAEIIAELGGHWALVPAGCRGARRVEDDFTCVTISTEVIDRCRAAEIGSKLESRRNEFQDVGIDDLRSGTSARWLIENERSGSADLDFILTSGFRTSLVPAYDGQVIRGIRQQADGNWTEVISRLRTQK